MLKSGDIVFIMHHRNKLSKIIAWFMMLRFKNSRHKSFECSHSAIVSNVNFFGRVLLTETSDVQVYANFFDIYLNDKYCSIQVLRDPSLTEQEREDVGYASTKQYGRLYGYLFLPAFAIRELIFMIFKILIEPFWKLGQVCCHVPSYAYRDALGNAHFLGRIDPESFHTTELREMLLDNGFEIVFEKKGEK